MLVQHVLAALIVVSLIMTILQFAFLPEFRPAMAVDGDPGTAWLVGTRGDPVGERLEVSATDGELVLLQPQRPEIGRAHV